MNAGKVSAEISAVQSKLGLLRNEIVRKDVASNPIAIQHIMDLIKEAEDQVDLCLQEVADYHIQDVGRKGDSDE